MIRTVTIPRLTGYRFRNRGGRIGDASSLLISGGISAGVSLATTGLSLWMNSIQLSHEADSATTAIVNGLATQLSNLDSAYLSEPNVTCADQRAALDAYDQAWAWLQSTAACGNPSYGSAGNACIADRAPTGKYPWQTYYRDPIANDPRLAGQGCDTSQDVLLPSLSTGTYADTGITASGGSAATGQTAQQIAAAAVAAAAAAAPASVTVASAATAAPVTAVATTTSTGISPTLIIGGVVLVAIFLFSGSGSKE